jgi:hypothetical protein
MTESQVDVHGDWMECLTGWDFTQYDHVSVSRDGFVLISVMPTTTEARLINEV